VKDAFALDDGPKSHAAPAKSRREDFTDADLVTDRVLRYWVKDNSLLGGVVYRLTVRERTDDRLVYEVENETAMTLLMVDAVKPGEFRQLHVFEREPGDASGEAWRYYALASGRIKWFRPSAQSFISRSDSYFRHMAGTADEPELRSAQ
jgi:hypothetical protein